MKITLENKEVFQAVVNGLAVTEELPPGRQWSGMMIGNLLTDDFSIVLTDAGPAEKGDDS